MRFGTKLVVFVGLVAMVVFYGWVVVIISVILSYGLISVQMVLYGLGMGLMSVPAIELIMGVISRWTVGVGLAVNDSTWLVGGTLGVAVIGSIFTSIYAVWFTLMMLVGVSQLVVAIVQ